MYNLELQHRQNLNFVYLVSYCVSMPLFSFVMDEVGPNHTRFGPVVVIRGM